VCCSVLQCVAASCSVHAKFNPEAMQIFGLRCVKKRCSVLQNGAACCSMLQWVAVWHSVLHCVAGSCSVIATSNPLKDLKRLSFQSMYSCVMQCVAVSCSVLQ